MTSIGVTLDLSEDSRDGVLTHLVDRATESFSFKAHRDGVMLCEKALATSIEPKTKVAVKRHVIVRNVVQHAAGRVRERDLHDMGGKYLVLLNERHEEVRLRAGDVVKLSFCDLVDAKEAFQKAAGELIG